MQLAELMIAEEAQRIGIDTLDELQQSALLDWGMRMFSLGQYVVGDIADVKYDGRLIVLEDGTRWEVDADDAGTAGIWAFLDKVIVVDDVMYRLEDAERVHVEQELDC